MIILGIDPGTAIIGYGVIESDGDRHKVLEVGTLRTSKDLLLSQRLKKIYKGITELLEMYEPDEVAIEQLFFSKNVKTAMSVSQARGVLLLGCVKWDKPIFEYSPVQIKQSITGYGKAPKDQVMKMVCYILNLKEPPKPDDAADALAIAMCHANHRTSPWMSNQDDITNLT